MEKREDKVNELKVFHSELVQFTNLVDKHLGRKPFEKQEEDQVSSLHVNIERKVGYLGHFIAKLSGIGKVNVDGKECDMWLIALKPPIGKLGASTLGACIQATNRAIGKLEDDILTGKRDKQTGELLTKSGISGSEPTEALIAKTNWKAIESELGITKRSFGRKINFITDPFKRTTIFRDVEQAFILASSGFSKPAVILAGSVIEELLRLYLEYKNVKPKSDNFDDYIEACKQPRLIKSGVASLSDSVRHFRNLVHLSREKTKKHSISKSTAKGAVSSIFTIANDF